MQKLSILIVEDGQSQREMLRDFLRSEGHTTIEAENGALGGDEMTSTYVTVDVKKAASIQTISS